MFFDSALDLFRVLLVGTLAYLSLVVLLRVSGKRTLSKWNAFDFIVTIALGSTLATVLLSTDVSLSEGVAALALLILLQFAITWLSVRVAPVRRLIKGEPAFLYRDGQFIDARLRQARVTRSEVRAAVRGNGLASLADVEAVVLETDGTFSVLRRSSAGDGSALEDVR